MRTAIYFIVVILFSLNGFAADLKGVGFTGFPTKIGDPTLVFDLSLSKNYYRHDVFMNKINHKFDAYAITAPTFDRDEYVVFSDSDDAIRNAKFNPTGLKELTISVFFSPGLIDKRYFFSFGQYLGLYLNASGYLYWVFNNEVDRAYATTSLEVNKWYNVVYVFDGSESNKVKIYLNGKKYLVNYDGTWTTYTQIPNLTSYILNISTNGSGGRAYVGKIKSVMCWKRVLSHKEISELYETTRR